MDGVNTSFIIIGIAILIGGLLLLNYAWGLFNTPPDNADNPDPKERKLTASDYVRSAIMVGTGIGGFIMAIFGLYMIVDGVRDSSAKKE